MLNSVMYELLACLLSFKTSCFKAYLLDVLTQPLTKQKLILFILHCYTSCVLSCFIMALNGTDIF